MTIDPSMTFTDGADLYTSALYPSTAYYKPSDLRVGTYDAGADKTRSYLAFNNWPNVRGAHVLSASLVLFDNWSYSCTARAVQVWEPSAQWTYQTTWNTQPGLGKLVGSASFAAGYSSSCPASYESIDVTPLAADWSTYAYNWGQLVLTASSETDNYGWKKFNSAEKNGTGIPYISVTYNSYPNTPTSPAPASGSYTANATPTLSAVVSDPDGGSVQGRFYLRDLTTNTWVSPSTGTYGTTVTSGGTSSWTAPPLTDGDHYQWQVYASDTLPDLSLSAAGWFDLYVDSTAPAAPAVNVAGFPQGQWTVPASPPPSVTLSWASASSDVVSYNCDLDGTVVGGCAPGTTATSTAWTPTPGWHTLTVTAVDRAGNTATASDSFGYALGGLTAPASNARTSKFLPVQVSNDAAHHYVTLQARVATNGAWTTIAGSELSLPGSSTPLSSSVFDTTNGQQYDPSGGLVWNVASTVQQLGVTAASTLVQVQACFGTTSTDPSPYCTSVYQPDGVAVTLVPAGDPHDASATVGPAQVDLVSGSATVSSTDVSLPTWLGALSVGRTSATALVPATPTPAGGVFGPNWVASFPGPATGAGDLAVSVASTSQVVFTAPDETPEVYAPTDGAHPGVFVGQGDAAGNGVSLTETTSGATVTSITRTDPDGTLTGWAPSGPNQGWQVSTVTPASSTGTPSVSYVYDTSGRVAAIIGATPPGQATGCTSSSYLTTTGCRSLVFAYATTTTATADPTGVNPATWGDYAGRLVSITASLPGTSATSTVIERYAYDAGGFLRAAWDPRVSAGADCAGTCADLTTVYRYDETAGANPTLTGITAPGQAAWSFGYDPGHRLSTVTRPTPTGGTATWTVVYDLPVAGIGTSLPVLSCSATGATSAWGQTSDCPVAGAAVFDPTHVPAGTTAGTVAAGDWPYADLTYADVNGRPVNTASYGVDTTGAAGTWHLASTRYDSYGNAVWQLSAAGRDEALSAPAGTDPYVAALTATADRANALATVSTYSADGTELVSTLGPTHPVSTAAGVIDGRVHTSYVYDQAAAGGAGNTKTDPSGQPYRLVTATTTAVTNVGSGQDSDAHTTWTGYDAVVAGDGDGWTLRLATSTTVDPGGLAATTITRYDGYGRVVQTRLPSDAATPAAASTDTGYYTPTGSGACVNPAMAGFACQAGPHTQPGGSAPPLPVTLTSYDAFGQPVTVTETVTGAHTTVRTTSTSYDPAERPVTVSVSVTPAGDGGAAVPDTTTSYDPATGLKATVAAGADGTVTYGYDTWGQQTTRTETDGSGTVLTAATTGYDALGRVVSVADGKGVTSYRYDTDPAGNPSGVEHRGLLTYQSDTLAGVFTAGYNYAGLIISRTDPGGLAASYGYDDTGAATTLTWALPGGGGLAYTATRDSLGRVVAAASPDGTQAYGYDPASRLTAVADTVAGVCVTRAYGFSANSDRVSLATYPAGSGGACSTSTTPTTVSRSFDAADRLVDPGYVYDPLGRTTSVPAVDTAAPAGGDLTVGYTATDAVASMTQGGVTRTFTDTPTGVIRSVTDSSTGVTTTSHYTGDSDSPAWQAGSDGTLTRLMVGPDGLLAATTDATGTVTLQLTDLAGSVTAQTTPGAASTTWYAEASEYGVARDAGLAGHQYGWLGGHTRATDPLAGIILMGARLYDPTTGRFLSVDPVPGGSANAYDYANQDPINSFDLDGRWSCGWCQHAWRATGSMARTLTDSRWGRAIHSACAYIPGFLGSACGAVYAVAYAREGRWREASREIVLAAVAYVGGRAVAGGLTIGFGGRAALDSTRRFGILRTTRYISSNLHGLGAAVAVQHFGHRMGWWRL